jgi:hypothetical protein
MYVEINKNKKVNPPKTHVKQENTPKSCVNKKLHPKHM